MKLYLIWEPDLIIIVIPFLTDHEEKSYLIGVSEEQPRKNEVRVQQEYPNKHALSTLDFFSFFIALVKHRSSMSKTIRLDGGQSCSY